MSFDKEAVPKLVLLPPCVTKPELLAPLSWSQLISWLYRYPQALEAYIDLLESSRTNTDARGRNELLNELTEKATLIGIALFLLMSFVYGTFRIVWRSEFLLLDRWLIVSIIAILILAALGLSLTGDDSITQNFLTTRLLRLRRTFIINIVGVVLFGFLLFVPIFNPALTPDLTWPFMYYTAVVAGILAASFTRLFFHSQEATPVLNIALSSFVLIAVLLSGIILGFFSANRMNVVLSTPVLLQGLGVLLTCLTVYAFGTLRPDDWLWAHFFDKSKEPENEKPWPIPHVTMVGYAPIATQLNWQFKNDWKAGLANSHAIIQNSYQKQYVLRLIRNFLQETDKNKDGKNVVEQAMMLVDNDLERALFFCASAQYGKTISATQKSEWVDR